MILKESKLLVSDTCGIWTVKCFHIYQNKKKKWGQAGKFIKVSYRTMTKKLIKLRGKKSRALFFKGKQRVSKPDGACFRFWTNNCVTLKRRVYPRGKTSFGCVTYNIKRRKFAYSFPFIL